MYSAVTDDPFGSYSVHVRYMIVDEISADILSLCCRLHRGGSRNTNLIHNADL